MHKKRQETFLDLRLIGRAIIGVISMLLGAWVASIPATAVLYLLRLITPSRRGTGEMVVSFVFTAIIIGATAGSFRAFLGWRARDFFVSLLLAEIILFLFIAAVTGYFEPGNPFDMWLLEQLFEGTIYIGLTWMLGFGLGEIARLNGVTHPKKLLGMRKFKKGIKDS